MSNITKVTLKAIYNHDQWSLTTSINQNTNMSDGGDDDDCDGSVKSKQQVVRRLAITVTGVHSLLTDRPHNPPLLRTPFVSCLLKIVVLQFFIGLWLMSVEPTLWWRITKVMRRDSVNTLSQNN